MIQLDNGDYMLVEEDVHEVATRLNADVRLVELTRMWGRKRDKVYVNPVHVRHVTSYEAPVADTGLTLPAEAADDPSARPAPVTAA